MARYIPAVPKYNLNRIFLRAIIIIVVLAIIAAIFAQYSYIYTYEEPEYEKLVINGPHCKVPDFEPTSIEDLGIKYTKPLIPCHKPRKSQRNHLTGVLSSTRVEDPLFLRIYDQYFSEYGVSNATCCYHATERVRNSDSLINIHELCKEFQQNDEIDKSLATILVKCSSGGEVIYSNVHAVIAEKQEFQDRQEEKEIDKSKAYKVLLVGFDSISRMHFPRGMPNMYEIFNDKKEWIEMKGYTRLGNETFLNLFAALTGKSPTEKYGKCNPNRNTFLDDCDFIWEDYEKSGYVTTYAEDQKDHNTFNQRHKGFNKQPTDHYFRPFVTVAEGSLDVNITNGLAYCLGKTLYMDYIFIFAQKTISIHENDPYFGLYYVNSLSDKQFSSTRPLDLKISQSFMKQHDDVNDTIIIYFSDKGLRFETDHNGFYEERSPFLAIRLPLQFQEDHPDLARNLRLNANRLTTPYDFYATLRHIINLSTDTKLETKSKGCRMCKSLFNEIPIGRKCSDVNIPYGSCPCSLVKLDGTEKVLQFATQHSIEILNEDLKNMTTESKESCAKLKLSNVTSAYQQLTSPWHIQYIIQFSVSPSQARFEAILERTMKTLISVSPHFRLMQALVHLNEEPICIPNAPSSDLDNEKEVNL